VTGLAALKTGPGFPAGDFQGRVHSVFPRAVIIAPDGGRLLTIVPRAAGALPAGVTVDAEPGFSFDGWTGRGEAAAARSGVLRIGSGGFAVDLRPAAAWRSGLADLRLDMANAASYRARQRTQELLTVDGRHLAFKAIAGGAPGDLAAATRGLDAGAARSAVGRLIGLGAGGTPAGDDFLVGFVAALWASRRGDRRREAFLAEMGRTLRACLARTSAVSAVYLEAAAEGEVSETLTRLVAAVAGGAAIGAVEAAARPAIAVGHTSGADGVFGFVAGAEAWG
jgi:hypothetical protein